MESESPSDWKHLFLKQAAAEADRFMQNPELPDDEDEWAHYLREEERVSAEAEERACDPWACGQCDPWSQPTPPQIQSPPAWTYVYRPFDPSTLPPVHLRTPLFGSVPATEPEVLDWTPLSADEPAEYLLRAEVSTQTQLGESHEVAIQTGDAEEFYDCSEFNADETRELNMVDLDLAVCEKPGYVEVKVTMDSGAAEPVSAPETFPGVEVTPSAGSIAGQMYLGPGKERIPNEGQIKPELLLEDDAPGSMTFQAAQVRKPLMAVSSVNDKGHLVLFDNAGSFLIPSSAPEVALIRTLVQQAKGKLRMHRENGVFHLKTWRKAFARPEK